MLIHNNKRQGVTKPAIVFQFVPTNMINKQGRKAFSFFLT